MGAVRVVTDGAADLPPSLATSLGITTVRGGIRFGDEPWDGTVEDFWQRVAHGASPSARLPVPTRWPRLSPAMHPCAPSMRPPS